MSEVAALLACLAEVALTLLACVGLPLGSGPPPEQEVADVLACLACKQVIPEGQARCPACGWTYAGSPEEQAH
jgi:hypothetical protein